MYYRLHIETGIAISGPAEAVTTVTPEIRGAKAAAAAADAIYRALTAGGQPCTILRRDRAGRGRLLQPVVL